MGRRGEFARRAAPAVVGAIAVVAVAVWLRTIPDDRGPVPTPPAGAITYLSLDADRDFPRLPAWDVWKNSGADHCWNFGASGTVTDDCGDWDLTASGSPRTGVVTGVPVEDSTGWVDWDGELGAGLESSAKYTAAPVTYSATSIAITAPVWANADTDIRLDHGWLSGAGVLAYAQSGSYRMQVEGEGAGVLVQNASAATYTPDGSWQCVSWVWSGKAGGADNAIYVNGISQELSTNTAGNGTVNDTGVDFEVDRAAAGAGIARVSVRYGAGAVTLADHKALCGSWGAPVRTAHPAVADISWTQSGGARCYQTASNRATCFPGGAPAYAYSAALKAAGYSGYGYVAEPDRTNHILYSTAVDCTNWTCRGTATATAGQVAPDGSATATDVTVYSAGNDVLTGVLSGYSNSANLFPSLWIKCASGSVVVDAAGSGSGLWIIDCAAVSGGNWALVSGSLVGSGLSESSAWVSSGTGTSRLRFVDPSGSGITASIWAPTLTETDGISVIPTGSAAVSTGDVVAKVDNTGGKYLDGHRTRISWVVDHPLGVPDSATWLYYANDPLYVYGNVIYMRDANADLFARCGLPSSGAFAASLWWNATAGVAGLDVDGTAVTCSPVPSSPWTARGDPGAVYMSGPVIGHTGIWHTIKVEDRP